MEKKCGKLCRAPYMAVAKPCVLDKDHEGKCYPKKVIKSGPERLDV